jgi:endonuclease/exonuclease/phosphatase family metal-dependent hydrolase
MLGLLSRRGHSHWRGTLDYIFVDPGVEVQRCEVAFQRHAPNNPQIYPSDHLGLTATLQHPDA